MDKVYRKVPEVVKSTLLISEGWLVGSSLTKLLNNEDVKDYDIIVPSREKYQLAVKALSNVSSPEINSCGGLKFTTEHCKIDIWPEELDHFLRNGYNIGYIYSFKGNILIKNQNG